MLAGGGVGPFAGCSFAVQRPEQADIEAASRRVRDIADNPVAALAVTIGEIMTAHSLGAARETVSELSGLGGHDAFLVTGAKLVAAPLVMAGLVPAIPIIGHLCHPDRDRRDKPGDDATSFAPVTIFEYPDRPCGLSDINHQSITYHTGRTKLKTAARAFLD